MASQDIENAFIMWLSGIAQLKDGAIKLETKYNENMFVRFPTLKINYFIITKYYKNGNKARETEYKNGKLHGKDLCWCENGNKRWEIEYKNGKLHGKYLFWWNNGNLFLDENFVNDLKNGKCLEYDYSGKLILIKDYKYGEVK